MQQLHTSYTGSSRWILKGTALAIALGLHAGVLATVFMSDEPKMVGEPAMEQIVGVDLLEFPDPDPGEPQLAQAEIEQPPEPEEIVEEEPEPEPEEEVEPEPEPEPVVEDPVIPEQVVQPKPKPKPKPRPQPRPEPTPRPEPAEQPAAPATRNVATETPSTTQAGGQQAAQTVDPNRPRVISQVNYLGPPPQPVYPRASERRREQGRVIVRVLISTEGSVIDVSVRTSSGHSRLDEAAISAVRRAQFKPYTENGVAYRAMADIPFDFVL
jgi:protein TonB